MNENGMKTNKITSELNKKNSCTDHYIVSDFIETDL